MGFRVQGLGFRVSRQRSFGLWGLFVEEDFVIARVEITCLLGGSWEVISWVISL